MIRHLIEWFQPAPAVVLSARRIRFAEGEEVAWDTSEVVKPAVRADAPHYVHHLARLDRRRS